MFKTEPLIFNPKLTHPKAFPTWVSASCFLRTSLMTRSFFTLVLSHPTSAHQHTHQQSQLWKTPRTSPLLPAHGATSSTSAPHSCPCLSLVPCFHSCRYSLFSTQWPEGSSRPPLITAHVWSNPSAGCASQSEPQVHTIGTEVHVIRPSAPPRWPSSGHHGLLALRQQAWHAPGLGLPLTTEAFAGTLPGNSLMVHSPISPSSLHWNVNLIRSLL